MTILSLNNDVLLVMLSYLERHDLSMTMKTCKALHELCVPVILRAPLTLSPENIISFRQFICSTACDRGRYLRGIHLEWDSMKPYEVVQKQAIVDILGSSPRLQSLSVQSLACLEYPGNDAADTLKNIPALRRLRLAEITDHGWTVLSKVKFPLTHLHIGALWTTHTGFDGIPNVAQWAGTLEVLSLKWCICRDISTSFPRLRRLRMNILPTVDISSLLSSLPMLQSLHLEYAATFGYPALAVQMHERNVLIQSRRAILPPIDELIVDTRTLYMLAPQFTVRTLWLTNLNDLFVGRDAIPDILQTLSPRQIRIGDMMVSILSYIGPNFLSPASKHLTHLAIGLNLYYHLPIDVAWDKLQKLLLLRIHGLRIKFLMLMITVWRDDIHAKLRWDSLLDDLLYRLAHALPCVEYIIVSPINVASQGCWNVIRDGDARYPTVTRTSDGVMMDILDENPFLVWPEATF